MKKLFLIFLVLFFYIGCEPCDNTDESGNVKKYKDYYVNCVKGFYFVIVKTGSYKGGIAITQIKDEDNKPIKCYEE